MLIKVVVDKDQLKDLETLEKTLSGLFLQAQILPEGKAEVIYRVTKNALCNLVTDTKLEQSKKVSCDIFLGIINSGGIRFDAETRDDGIYKAGDFTLEAGEILPFGDTIAIVDVTGAELKEILEHRASALPDAMGFFAQCSKGIVYEVDMSKPAEVLSTDEENPTVETSGERIVSITIDSTEIADRRPVKYTMSVEGNNAENDGYVTFRLLDCAQKMPEWECCLCALPVGSTYADALQQVAGDM